MEVRSDRRYRFPLGPEALWPVLTRVEDYRSWWPWLRGFDATAFEPGAAWTCVVQPPLPYSLRFRIVLDEVDPARCALATVDGDIVGDARLELTATDEGCEARLVSRLAPANPSCGPSPWWPALSPGSGTTGSSTRACASSAPALPRA